MSPSQRQKYLLAGLGGLIAGFILMIALSAFYRATSTNESCMACHVHPDSEQSWRLSSHFDNASGMTTDCAACHLPPEGTVKHFWAKTKMGVKDLWAYVFKDHDSIDWEAKGELEHASKIVYNESCKACHTNLYPKGISDDGIIAHMYYEANEKKLNLQCISCHLDVGHFNPSYSHSRMTGVPIAPEPSEIYTGAAEVHSFEDFTETVPGTAASLRMIAVPGGTFMMGSPEGEPFRGDDEGPRHRVTLSPFFMSEVEVTWDQYWAFCSETMSEGHTPPEAIYEVNNKYPDIDAVSGPTPAFGSPDQGWGMGSRPAITMTWYAAKTFCQWLSLKTGRNYRLPTEAEWEYAARGGTDGAYFWPGSPRKYSSEGFLKGIFKPDTTFIASHAIYALNSQRRTEEPSAVDANPFGLKNMLGNVMEYCSDWYSETAYGEVEDGALNPTGPRKGKEHVVRGGSYADDAAALRCAARGSTRHDEWLKTDPQNPKSIWWYSDIKGIGFRVVCDVPEDLLP